MKILLITPHFFPENFRINDLAFEFKKRGHIVSVLTGIPDYPEGNFFPGYGLFKKNHETINGVNIYRAPLISRGSGSNIRLSIHYLTLMLGSVFTSLFLFNRKFDIIFVFQPSPILIAIPAIIIKKIKQIPICLWVLDLWPESVVSARKLNNNFIPALLNPLTKLIYKNVDKILVSSKGFINSIVQKGINKDKLDFFPQWAEPIFKPIKKEHIINTNKINKKNFNVMFAGNIGEAQDFPSIIEAAKLLKKNKKIQWQILGTGSKLKWVEKKIVEFRLNKCFHLHGSYPIDQMSNFYAQADVMLFSLKDEEIFNITIPGKVQTYLACGKPVIAMVNGEAANIIKENKVGLTCSAGDYVSLAKKIEKMSILDINTLNEFSHNSLSCYNKLFKRSSLIDKLEKTIINMSSDDK